MGQKSLTLGTLFLSVFLVILLSSQSSAVSSDIQWSWGTPENRIVNNTAPPNPEGRDIYPIYDKPVGILSDGSDLQTRIESGSYPLPEYLEAIYLSTGNVGKGVYDISPKDGSHTALPSLTFGSSHIGEEIPNDFGPVVSSVTIYHSSVHVGYTVPREAVIVITSETGNVVGIKAEIIGYTASGSGEALLPISYERLWEHHIGDSISTSASVFYGKYDDLTYNMETDDKILVTTDSGRVCAFLPETGVELWNATLTGHGFYSPIPVDAGNTVVVVSRYGDIYGLNATDGSIIWNNKLDMRFSAPYISYYFKTYNDKDAVLYVGASDGSVYGIGISGSNAGKIVKSVVLRENSPVGNIFVTSDSPDAQYIFGGLTVDNDEEKGEIFCIRAETMETVWKHRVEGAVSKMPTYYRHISERAFFVTDKGYLYIVSTDGEGLLMENLGLAGDLNQAIVAPSIPHTAQEIVFVHPTVIVTSSEGDMCALATSSQNEVRWSDDGGTHSSGGIPGFDLFAFFTASAITVGVLRKKRK